jgi:hypothetical protein
MPLHKTFRNIVKREVLMPGYVGNGEILGRFTVRNRSIPAHFQSSIRVSDVDHEIFVKLTGLCSSMDSIPAT